MCWPACRSSTKLSRYLLTLHIASRAPAPPAATPRRNQGSRLPTSRRTVLAGRVEGGAVGLTTCPQPALATRTSLVASSMITLQRAAPPIQLSPTTYRKPTMFFSNNQIRITAKSFQQTESIYSIFRFNRIQTLNNVFPISILKYTESSPNAALQISVARSVGSKADRIIVPLSVAHTDPTTAWLRSTQ